MPGGSKKGGGLKTKSYSPYKMKGSPMYRNYGIGKPPKGTTSSESAEPGEKSPAKSFWKKAGKFIKGGGLVGMAARKVTGAGKNTKSIEDLDARITALEGGGEGEAAAVGGEAAAADPAAAAAAEGGDPQAAKVAAMKAAQRKAGGVAGMDIGGLSDIRAKEKLEKTGVSPSGIPIYEFNYIGSEARYSGAMAQDLLEMGVDAVSMHEDGYYRVNYNNIDVDMRQIN